ncbi:MAG: hypothetical protein LBE91_22075 [Tannerella sp.]|jgi:hypothetical protein|nr:hypothetical protein [Tannerella sp.]
MDTNVLNLQPLTEAEMRKIDGGCIFAGLIAMGIGIVVGWVVGAILSD